MRHSEGKIHHIGLSNVSSRTLRRALAIAPIAAVQTDYSPFVLDAETATSGNILSTCRDLDISVVAYSPLGRGLLTSTFASGDPVGDEKDMRAKVMPRFMGENREKNVKLVAKFKALADAKGCSTSQLALAWLLRQGVIPNPGTKRVEYLEENLHALEVVLKDEEDSEIRRFAEGAEVAGPPIPERFLEKLYVDTVAER